MWQYIGENHFAKNKLPKTKTKKKQKKIQMKMKINDCKSPTVSTDCKHGNCVHMVYGYWRRQTHMHQRQTRSLLVAVSACTVPDYQTGAFARGTVQVPTNQMRAVQSSKFKAPSARVRTRFSYYFF